MSNRKKLIIKFVLVLSTIPALIHAFSTGPEPFVTGDPADPRGATCNQSGCHVGTGVNQGGGNVQITTQPTYKPGVAQDITVTVSDASERAYGFELTVRKKSDNTQVGNLKSTDSSTFVQCADSSTQLPCPTAVNTQFIQHTAPKSGQGSASFTVQWIPPAADAGPVAICVAGNAVNRDGTNSGDHVYTSSATLTAAAVSGSGPTIDPGGIVPVYSSATTIQPGSWVSIFSFGAKNLSSGTSVWNGDFPTTLGDVTVTINGKKAYLWFVSPAQINIQAPDDTATGSVPVVVTNASGSTSTTVTLAPSSPSFLLLADAKHATGVIITPNGSGAQGGGTYDLVGPTGSGGGARPVKKGEPLVLYGVGFGPTNPAVPAGSVFNGAANLVTKPQITLGGVPVTVDFAGIIGAGLYQFNFTVPQNVGSGDQPLVATVAGVMTQANVSVPVQ